MAEILTPAIWFYPKANLPQEAKELLVKQIQSEVRLQQSWRDRLHVFTGESIKAYQHNRTTMHLRGPEGLIAIAFYEGQWDRDYQGLLRDGR